MLTAADAGVIVIATDDVLRVGVCDSGVTAVSGVAEGLGVFGVPFWLWSDDIGVFDDRFIAESVVESKTPYWTAPLCLRMVNTKNAPPKECVVQRAAAR